MVIHSASDPRPRTTLCADYFYNYFTRGLDILFDGQVFKTYIPTPKRKKKKKKKEPSCIVHFFSVLVFDMVNKAFRYIFWLIFLCYLHYTIIVLLELMLLVRNS